MSDSASFTSVGSCPSHGSESSAASTASGGDSGMCTCDSSSAGSSSLTRRKTTAQKDDRDSKQVIKHACYSCGVHQDENVRVWATFQPSKYVITYNLVFMRFFTRCKAVLHIF